MSLPPSPPQPLSMTAKLSPYEMTSRLSDALHAIALRIVLVDGRGALCHANEAAQSALRAGCGLAVRGGMLFAAVASQQGSLERAIGAAVAGRRSLLELGAPGGSRLVAVLPLGGEGAGREPMVLLVTGQYEPMDATVITLFAKATGLTPSEREVLVALCDGIRPQDIARRRAVSLSTVRAQIGAIREKVGVNTITSVVRKVSTLPPVAPFRMPAAGVHVDELRP
jgi:DNA-binding CsgD family transcriptional regulator